MRELVTQAEVSGGRALVGTSYAEGGMPYAPFRQNIREVFSIGSSAAIGDGFDLPEFVLAHLLKLARCWIPRSSSSGRLRTWPYSIPRSATGPHYCWPWKMPTGPTAARFPFCATGPAAPATSG